jgi:PIN domain nuclease of toxin-antitoxin system
MNYLLDTHVAIWALLGNDSKLSDKAKSIIADRNVKLAFSIASAWEIAIKISKKGEVEKLNGIATFINSLKSNHVEILGVTPEEVIVIESLPYIHNDPFDRLIIATAKTHGYTIITKDDDIQKYNVSWVW